MRTGTPAFLVSAVGNDLAAQTIRQGMEMIGMSTQYVQCIPDHPTAVYNAIHSKSGQLIAAVADMDIFDALNSAKIDTILHTEKPALVCFDGNLATNTMARLAATSAQLGIPVFFEPTSVPKSLKIFEQNGSVLSSGAIKFVSPNHFELEAMSETARSITSTLVDDKHTTLTVKGPALAQRVLPYALHLSHMIPHIITKLGEDGCLYTGRSSKSGKAIVQYFEPEQVDSSIISVTGAGDCFVGTLLANLRKHLADIIQEQEPDNAIMLWKQIISRAQKAAVLTLQSDLAVSPSIDHDLLYSK
ncbi:Ribokinase-like protein [Zychaea mexicana]|uniref:Ribokinase-like protein n=1 Tax=Zychaea mexicana TaxID=64656 RepID=UPI0022FE267F|nr:Ribokinase-like protein [Zychaea mexicana]KAI9484635.1 Ribokinase-like protein [Zychaea mexicana]